MRNRKSSRHAIMKVIQEEDQIILKRDKHLRLVQVHRGRDVWLDRTKFTLDGIIGHPYGTRFEVKDGAMVKLCREVKTEFGTATGDTEKDNRNLQDQDSNQKLTMEEIEAMKRDGVARDKLIEHLIENSTTFQEKTEYAQAKWIKKKKKKHLLEFTILRPTSRLLCEMQREKNAARICNLRLDTLAQMMTWGNVRANMTVAVVDTCQGLVTGAVLERLAGMGRVISFYHGDFPMKACLNAYGFPQEVMDSLYHFPLDQVNSLQYATVTEAVSDSIDKSKDAGELEGPAKSSNDSANGVSGEPEDPANNDSGNGVSGETVDKSEAGTDHVKCETDPVQEEEEEESFVEDTRGKKGKKNKKNRKRPSPEERQRNLAARKKEIEAARNVILEKKIDCLIVACKFHPTPIVLALVDYVLPSRQIVVYSQFKEALQDCYVYLRECKGLVSYRLTETWLRDYQVLPSRTHPVIQMSGTGGFLLTATTIVRPS